MLANKESESSKVNDAKGIENMKQNFHGKSKDLKERAEKEKNEEEFLKLQCDHEEKLKKKYENVQIECKRDTKEMARFHRYLEKKMRKKAEVEVDKISIEMQEKDIVIKKIIKKDKQQSTNMAKQEAETRSQPQEIERQEAMAFTNTNITLLDPGKQNQKEGSCKRNIKR